MDLIEPSTRKSSFLGLSVFSVPKGSVVNKDLSFKAKDLTSEHVQGPLYRLRGAREHETTKK